MERPFFNFPESDRASTEKQILWDFETNRIESFIKNEKALKCLFATN